jgi:hypothetical protein
MKAEKYQWLAVAESGGNGGESCQPVYGGVSYESAQRLA